MKNLPHEYVVVAEASSVGDAQLIANGLSRLATAPPIEFGGPGDRWSPEMLLVAALGDCFVLTFRAVAAASHLPWNSLRCEVSGTLDRMDRVMQFTGFDVRADLRISDWRDSDRARRALDRAEHNCLISNSLKAAIHLASDVQVDTATVGEAASLLP
jgi:organic hydroperoxide reductase OsmC/OhrA